VVASQLQFQANAQSQYQALMQNGWQAYQGYPTFPNANNTANNANFAQQNQANVYVPSSSRPRVRVMSSGTATRQAQDQPLQQYGNYGNYGYGGNQTNYAYTNNGPYYGADNYGSMAQAAMDLTPSQRARLARQQHQQERTAQHRTQTRMNPGISPRFSNGFDVSQQRFSTVVGPQGAEYDQRWNQMTGTAFDYPVDVYFTSGGSVAPAGQ
jgi:hypothetical protein